MKFYIEVAAATVLALAFAVPSSADDDIGDSATGKIYIILFTNLEEDERSAVTYMLDGHRQKHKTQVGGRSGKGPSNTFFTLHFQFKLGKGR